MVGSLIDILKRIKEFVIKITNVCSEKDQIIEEATKLAEEIEQILRDWAQQTPGTSD